MQSDPAGPVRTFVLVPELQMGHALARKLREDPTIQVIGFSTDPDQDAFRIFDENPDVIVTDVDAGGLQFLSTTRLPPGKHRVVFFAPRSESGCEACYEALLHGAHGILCRPASPDEASHCDQLLESIRQGTPWRPENCPAVERLRHEAMSQQD